MATSDRRNPSTPGTDGEWHRWQMDDLGHAPDTRLPAFDAEAQRQRRQQDADAEARQAASEKAKREGFEIGHREGQEQGYRAGYQEGLEASNAVAELEFHKRLEMTLNPLAELAENFRQALMALDTEVADQLVELALITGRQLAGESLAAHPEQILCVVRELLDADTSLNGKPRLWLHPADLELVTAAMGEKLAASGWECHPDPALERGGCRATSAGGGLDASLSTHWKAILGQRRQRQASPASESGNSETGDSTPGTPGSEISGSENPAAQPQDLSGPENDDA
ncbi:flagellar assembly protein FliH [Salinicola halimionae]|uniref:flagellar assembly protein FliH n=1 Tax=Salinicola halimionae TaxID=1949081 RepID=UPI000DA1BEA7|nr:flagellar assembly protein FliH [Salinicola halimionae]